MSKSIFLAMSFILIGCESNTPLPVGVDPLKKLESAAAQNPSYENLLQLGLELAHQKRSAEAIETYKRAIGVNAKAPLAWNNICAVYNDDKKFADAMPNCEKAVLLEPHFALAQNNLKYAKDSLAKAKVAAKKKMKEALARSKEQGKFVSEEMLNLGMELYDVRELDSAIQVWSQLKAGDVYYANAQNDIASAYILLKKYDRAQAALEIALKLVPKSPLYNNNKKWLDEERAGHK